MTFIKTQHTITIEAESGEIFRITPVEGFVHIEIEQYQDNEMNDTLIENWKNEDGFAKPEWQRNQDWIPEDDEDEDEEEDEEEFSISKNKIKKAIRPIHDMGSWPLP